MSTPYMDWIHDQPCLVASRECSRQIHAHHIRNNGMARKCPDTETVPLCDNHHEFGPKAIHRIGKKSFQSHFGIDLVEEVAKLQARYERCQ